MKNKISRKQVNLTLRKLQNMTMDIFNKTIYYVLYGLRIRVIDNITILTRIH